MICIIHTHCLLNMMKMTETTTMTAMIREMMIPAARLPPNPEEPKEQNI